MKTYRYWATYEGSLRLNGQSQVAVFLGGSNYSEEAARRNAMAKCDAVQRKINGSRAEFADYEVEIRELQIHEFEPGAVITRNRYGAHILNAQDLLILDVDEPPTSFRDLFAQKTDAWKLDRLLAAVEKLQHSLRKPNLGFRIYRTFKGFRVIVAGEPLLPRSKLANQLSQQLNTDRLYWLLCQKQDCYRARLTPKPYRMKYRPIKVRLPEALEQSEAILEWDRGYLEAARQYSVCHWVETVGSKFSNRLIDYHDQTTGAYEKRPLA